LKRICAAEKVNVICFEDEDETSGNRWAHVYVQDDAEHRYADVFVGTIGRDDRYITTNEIAWALERWSQRPSSAFNVSWWNGPAARRT
jgi:hypothetical protein